MDKEQCCFSICYSMGATSSSLISDSNYRSLQSSRGSLSPTHRLGTNGFCIPMDLQDLRICRYLKWIISNFSFLLDFGSLSDPIFSYPFLPVHGFCCLDHYWHYFYIPGNNKHQWKLFWSKKGIIFSQKTKFDTSVFWQHQYAFIHFKSRFNSRVLKPMCDEFDRLPIY